MILLDALLYGRLYLPNSTLEALYLRRLSPRSQLKISCVSDPRLPNGGSILALFQHDAARYSTEYIYSTDSSLIGVRGLYNFGPAPSPVSYPPLPSLSSLPLTTPQLNPPTITSSPSSPSSQQPQKQQQQHPRPHPPHGLFSAGAELYYSPINKSSGMSCGLRFATLPAHAGFPYTMTLTLNPLMGNFSSTYSVVASRALTLSSCFDFNFYSYESELKLGFELWRKKRYSSSSPSPSLTLLSPPPPAPSLLRENNTNTNTNNDKDTNPNPNLPFPPPLPSSPPSPSPPQLDEDQNTPSGVLKARLDHRGAVALLWESRAKDLLYSCGVVIDARRGEGMVRSVGIEISYSS